MNLGSRRRKGLVLTVAAATLAVSGSALSAATAASAGPVYTVTVGAKGTWSHPDDTPAAPYIDKDGTFYYQQSHSLYGPNDGRTWSFYTGTNFDSATRSNKL